MRELIGREINEASGVGAFLRRWHGADPALQNVAEPPRRSATGNINLAATEYSSTSALLAAGDAGFEAFLEPGVAPLVMAVVAAGWISYTSCEGHLYGDGTADELHAGLIVRNDDERAAIERVWADVAIAWAGAHPASAVELAIARGTMRCDGRIDVPTLDLYLCRARGHRWDAYFDTRTDAAAEIAAWLTQRIGRCA